MILLLLLLCVLSAALREQTSHVHWDCVWVGSDSAVRSRSVYGCQSKIAAVAAGKARANSVCGRCGKQLPVICCLHLAALFQLFPDQCIPICEQALFNGVI